MSFIENAKTYTGRDLETIFFRPMLSGQSALDLGVRILYNMPAPTTVQLWERSGDILQQYTAAGWTGGDPARKLQKTIGMSKVKAELGYSAADYFSMIYELITNRADVNMDDLTGTELEQAETELFKRAIAESLRVTMWIGDKEAGAGTEYATFNGFIKRIYELLVENKITAAKTYAAADLEKAAAAVDIFDAAWTEAAEELTDLKPDGQLVYFVTSDLYHLYEKYLDSFANTEAAYIGRTEGRPVLTYHGIPVVDLHLSSYLRDTTYAQSFCLLTDRRNLVLAVNTSDFPGNEIRMWYNPDLMEPARSLHGRLRSARRETRVVRLQGVIRPGRRDPDRAFRPAFFHRLMDNAQNSSTLPRKPVGGIRRVRLASARAFSPQSRFAEYELIDDRSAYVETLTADEGLLRVRHTLTLVFDKHQADAWFDRRWLERCATDGVVAAIETAAGERLRIGRSDRFGCEQALRLERFTFASGAAPGDRPTATLVLASEDTDRAQTDTDDYEED